MAEIKPGERTEHILADIFELIGKPEKAKEVRVAWNSNNMNKEDMKQIRRRLQELEEEVKRLRD